MISRRIVLFYLVGLLVLPSALGAEPALARPDRSLGPRAQATNVLTFFVASDLHYGWPINGSNVLQRKFIEAMNATPGIPYPESVGGSVNIPRGVLLLGDLIQDGSKGNRVAGEKDWVRSATKRIQFPVF